MKLEEALDVVGDGHSVISVKRAKEVSETLGVKFNLNLIREFYSDWSPSNYKGLKLKEGCEGMKGVNTLDLSLSIARSLGVAEKAEEYNGRGSQARAYAKVIKEAIKERK